MKTPEDDKLEKFIHEQLQKLPERQAPDDLVTNVLAALARKESRPWWRQPFTCWPKGPQVVLFAGLVALLGVVAHLLSGPAEQVSFTALQERVLSFAWVAETATTLGNALLRTLQGVTFYWLVAAAGVIFTMYLACVAGGVALWRIASTHSLRQS